MQVLFKKIEAIRTNNNNDINNLRNELLDAIKENNSEEVEDGKEKGVPVGTIVMWSGTNLPSNGKWALCDGNNGTPDLRDRFVVGAGNSYDIGARGGANTVKLTKDEMPEHKHLMWFNGNNAYNPWGSVKNMYSSPTDRGILSTEMSLNYNQPVGKSQPHENRPPYYALAYIMKIKE